MKLYQKSELKDSRIFFDKKPPMFLTVFIIFTAFLLVLTVGISSVLSKSYVVEAQGVITTEDNTYVGSLADGVVVDMKYPEGSYVQEGEVLFTVSSGSEGVQYQSLTTQIEQQQAKLVIMDRYVDSLNAAKNYMKNEGLEQEYYAKIEYYMSMLKDEQTSVSNTQTEIQTKKQKRIQIENEIVALQEKLLRVTDSEEDIIKKEEYESEIKSKQSEIETLDTEISQTEQQMSSSQAYQTKLQLLSEVGTARTTTETAILELQGQIEAYKTQDALSETRANHTGYIHYLVPLKPGMTVQKMQTIAEISENAEQQMQIEAYINATDISKVEEGNTVKVAINGVNTQKYGTLEGTLQMIDVGTITQETSNGNIILYRCIVSIDEKQLVASNGDVILAIKSMPVTARIVYEKETYLDWILDMLNFRNK